MGKNFFYGGVHPTDGKDKSLTAGKEIISFIPKTVRISMKHGLGPNCECLVQVGEQVKQGQLIGESKHFLTASLHSPVTGKVTRIEDGMCEIEVEACELPSKTQTYYNELVDISKYEKEEILTKLGEGGLVGMGGAGFPTSAKYQTKDTITHLLMNASECEPYLTCDEHMMLEQGMAILNGVRLLKKASGAQHAIICMEDNKSHCMDRLKALLGNQTEIEFQLLPTRYPQGGEKQLILAVMGVEIPSGKLPANVGAIVSNVQTAKAVADIVLGGIPSTSRCITITGDVKNPGNYLVPLGTSIGELVEAAGDVIKENNKVILGGPMTGRCIGENISAKDITDTVTKVSGGLIVLDGKTTKESACIKCGACVEACPIGLAPAKIDAAVRRDKIDLCKALQATECIACGCCSYICPAKRELTLHTVSARDRVRAKLREEASRG